MPRTWLQIGRKEDIPIIIQAAEKIKQTEQAFYCKLRFPSIFFNLYKIAPLLLFKLHEEEKKLQKKITCNLPETMV